MTFFIRHKNTCFPFKQYRKIENGIKINDKYVDIIRIKSVFHVFKPDFLHLLHYLSFSYSLLCRVNVNWFPVHNTSQKIDYI